MSTLIVGDVAGQYDAFLKLCSKAPGAKIVCVGDIIDRGPKSKEMVQHCMDNDITVVMGNHEQLMLSFFKNPDEVLQLMRQGHLWHRPQVGGEETMISYGVSEQLVRWNFRSFQLREEAKKFVPKEHLDWLAKRPLFYQEPGLLVTHAPIAATLDDWTEALEDDGAFGWGISVTWCRRMPREREFFQVFGHNSGWGLSYFGTDEDGDAFRSDDPLENYWGMCIDHSRYRKLTGLLWPEKEIIQVGF